MFPPFSGKLGDMWHMFCYWPDTFPVTKSTVWEHWRKHKILTASRNYHQLASFFLHPPLRQVVLAVSFQISINSLRHFLWFAQVHNKCRKKIEGNLTKPDLPGKCIVMVCSGSFLVKTRWCHWRWVAIVPMNTVLDFERLLDGCKAKLVSFSQMLQKRRSLGTFQTLYCMLLPSIVISFTQCTHNHLQPVL